MSGTHSGRVAVVTGAGRGIGQAIAEVLAARGASVVLVDRVEPSETAEMLAAIICRSSPTCLLGADWERVAALTMERFCRADIVVNNAAILPVAHIDDMSFEDWTSVLRINLDSHFLSAKNFVPLMRKNNWGRFVNISSNSIGVPAKGLSHYMASKMGVVGFVRGLANDLGGHGITVNALLPAITNTRPWPCFRTRRNGRFGCSRVSSDLPSRRISPRRGFSDQ